MRPEAQEFPHELLNGSEDALDKEVWERDIQELINLRQEVFNKAKNKIGDEGDVWFNDKLRRHNEKLRRLFGKEVRDFKAYHILAYSTVYQEDDTKLFEGSRFDFPEAYSVRTFLESCIKELNEYKSKSNKE